MSNIEGRHFIDFYEFKRQSAAVQSFEIRYSAVRCSARLPAAKATSLIISKPCHFGEVSYKRRLWPRASSLIGIETDERRTSNVEHRTSNKCILSVLKKISRSDSIIRHSSFHEVSYKISEARWQITEYRFQMPEIRLHEKRGWSEDGK